MFDSTVTDEMIHDEALAIGFDDYVTVQLGIFGYFAVVMSADGPLESSMHIFRDRSGAEQEARDWASVEQLPLLLGA